MSSKSRLFKEVPISKPKKNFFELGHEVKMSGKMGKLMPILAIDTVPGDVFINDTQIMLRFAPMLAPIMHRVDVTTHFFFVPNRLVWDEWENFITGGPDGDLEPVSPYLAYDDIHDQGTSGTSTLYDYLGLPPLDAEAIAEPISSLPFRAYQLIYNEYYRDQNVTTELDIPKTSGDDSSDVELLTTLRNRAWEKDYFTSALPWPQRGADVLIPMEGIGDVTYKSISELRTAAGGTMGATNVLSSTASQLENGFGDDIRVENIDEITVTNANVTINDLRRSIRLQEWLENNARGGARYTEQIMSHFGIRVPDYRLQRPEYLGGGKQPVVISEVLATSAAESTPIGDMYGHGLSVGKSNRFKYQCLEHGWIIGLISILPRTAYSQGIPRKFSRTSKFDYFFKEFAQIGEQEIKNKELYFSGSTDPVTGDNGTFGYSPRYAEYKFENDRVAGDFRDTLEFWHLSRAFTSPPTLSTSFIECDAFAQDMNRIFAVTTDTDNLWMQIYNDLKAYRPMPYFGVPTI